MSTIQAKDLVEGQTVETRKGVKTVKTSGYLNEKLWRLEFTDWEICLCRHDPETAKSGLTSAVYVI
jgi:hypothetical protein